jgi:homoserine O-acetyltransferase
MVALEPTTQKINSNSYRLKATDWLIANCFLQEQILNNSSKPIQDARTHAMLCYRTPESFAQNFSEPLMRS